MFSSIERLNFYMNIIKVNIGDQGQMSGIRDQGSGIRDQKSMRRFAPEDAAATLPGEGNFGPPLPRPLSPLAGERRERGVV
jgi:hypothetical protein